MPAFDLNNEMTLCILCAHLCGTMVSRFVLKTFQNDRWRLGDREIVQSLKYLAHKLGALSLILSTYVSV